MADTQTLRGLDDVLRKLKALPPAIVSKRGGPVRKALRKGAVVVQKEWQSQIRQIVEQPDPSGYVSTGTLEKNVQVSLDSKPGRSKANEAYRVKIKRKTYPDGTKTIATARYLEFGTEDRPATPFATPGYFASRQKALDTIVTELNRGIDAIIKKLSRGA